MRKRCHFLGRKTTQVLKVWNLMRAFLGAYLPMKLVVGRPDLLS